MSSKFKAPKVQPPERPQPGPTTLNLQQNYFPKEVIPDPARLERLRTGAPEVYQAFVKQFEKDAEHNREMQLRAIAIDEKAVPALTGNDRLGIIAGWSVSAGVLGFAFFSVYHDIAFGWVTGLVVAMAMLVGAFRNKG